ncbi:MAG: 2-polyprenylphenol 6-hydroxylase, partial [Gammaproteobacteria bacterium]|nr:2-polyprenylphenol 6-hydroxylase [Gammaproteobacteria bacterium]
MNGQGRILARPLYIPWVLLRHGLDEIALSRFRLGRGLLYLLPWNWFRRLRRPQAERIRRALEDLGPIFVKFGQMLSTRRDLLPTDLADELALLQDQVPPFDGEVARKVIEQSLERPIQEMFSQFDTTPLASASVAQVHAARLGDIDVIVKVLRPGIEKTIRRDIRMMYRLARFLERVWEGSRRLHPVDLVTEYEGVIFDELDLTREAANASQLRRNFENSELLYVPEVFWDYTARDVMTMERIYGIQISDREELVRHGVDLKCLAERGVEIFFTQVFDHNFFHADMHPGNIFISRETPESPKYSAVDFGIMGSLSASDQRYLAFNLAAFFNNDYRRVAELHVESGWVPPGTRVADFEAAIRTVCEPIFQRPFSEISFANLLLRLFQTASRFQMEVQPQLLLLQKTLVN